MNANYFSHVLSQKLSWVFFVILMASGSIFAQTPCNRPLNPTVVSVTTNGATITWTPPDPAPWNGYEYWYTTIQGYSPEAHFTPSGSVTGTSVTFNQFTTDATIYVYVRSRCSTSRSTWYGPTEFTTLTPGSGCPNGTYGLLPAATFTPAYTGNPEVITTTAYAGQYSNISVIPDREYLFSSSVATDYITITNENLSGIVAYGTSPLTIYSNGFTGVLRFYLTTNSSCGTQQTNRTKYVTAKLPETNCGTPNGFYTSSISSDSAILHWTDTTPSLSDEFEYYYSTSPTTPSINITPDGSTTSTHLNLAGLDPNTTYYYWVRTVCSDGTTAWALGGNFTTQAGIVNGCTGALYGQNPDTPFTPACFGSPEIISTNMWAGELSEINILPNKTYTFTSSVATDFITIRDNVTSVGYASGTTPLVWSSGANTTQIKMFVHTNSTCGNQEVNRTTTITCQNASACAAPSGLNVTAVTNNSANMNWVAANPAPSGGYQYYYGTTNTAPTAGTAPSGSTTSTTLNLTNLSANTTYYIWVRPNCGSSQGNWVFGNSFATVGSSTGCTTAAGGLYPDATFTPACFGNNETIVTDAYAGEYTNVNILANTQYTFSSSVSSDYITITNANATVTYTAGVTPLVWLSGSNTGLIRYYLHTNSACGNQSSNRTRYIACQAAVSCNVPSGLSATGVTISGATLNWAAANPLPANGYQYYYSTSSAAPTASTSPTGNTNGLSIPLSGLTANTVYYFWVRSNCGTSQSQWTPGASFTTASIPVVGCTSDVWGQYPNITITPACTGANETIVTDGYAGEYSVIAISANKTYTFSSSIATDYITISNGDASVLYAGGVTPLVWQSGSHTGTIRYYFHADSTCLSDATNRSRMIVCSSTLADESFDSDGFAWYPNPVSDVLTISHASEIERVEVINMLGQPVQHLLVKSKEATIDMTHLPSGTYIVKAQADEMTKTFRIVRK